MKQAHLRRLAALAVFLMVFAFALTAFAQTGSLPPPTLTPTVGIVMVLSLVMGILNNWIQTGTVLGRWIPPQAWLPDVVMVSTLLGGFLGYIQSQNPVSLSGTNIFYGVVAGIAALLTSTTPAIASHAHVTLPAMRRAALKAAVATVAKTAGVLVLVGSLISATTSCGKPLFPTLTAIEQTVLDDIKAGKSPPQIDSDVCNDLGGTATTDTVCAGVTTLVLGALDLLELTGLIPAGSLPFAQAYRVLHPRPAPAAPATSSTVAK